MGDEQPRARNEELSLTQDDELPRMAEEELPMSASQACTLDADEAERRLRRWRQVLGGSLIGTESQESLVRLTLTDDAATYAELSELVELERSCCAFADWTLSEREGALQLAVTAGPEHADVLEEIHVMAEGAR